MLSEESTKEEVADYFQKQFKISEEAKNSLIKEDISGDVLLNIQDNEFKSFGIKIGPLKKIQKFLGENKDKFKEKEIKEVITAVSKPEEVKSFFDRCLNFKENLNELDGKGLIELDEAGMKKLGLNLGQIKRLVKYIEYFKTIKIEEPPKEEEQNFKITRKSTEKDIAKFLEKRLSFSQTSIDALALDGESLFLLEEKEIDDFEEITPEEKESLKKFLSEEKGKNEEKEEKKEAEPIITITNKSSEEEVAKFLKLKLGFKDEAIEGLGLDGESLFLLSEGDIDGFTEISNEEKEKLKNFLNEEKSKNKQSNQEVKTKEDETKKEEGTKKEGTKKEGTNEERPKKDETKKEGTKEEGTNEEGTNEEGTKEVGTKEGKTKEEGTKKDEIKKEVTKEEGTNEEGKIKDEGSKEEGVKEDETKKEEIIKDEGSKEEPNEKAPENLKKGKDLKEVQLKLTKESNEEEIKKFIEEKVNLKKEFNLLSESDIENISNITQEEKDILKIILKERKEKSGKLRGKKKEKDGTEPAPPFFSETDENSKINSVKKEKKDKDDKNGDNIPKAEVGRNRNSSIKNNNNNNQQKIKDPLSNQYVMEQKVEKEDEKIKLVKLKNCKVQPLINSKYNIFFTLSIQEKIINYISISTFFEKNGYLSPSYINYNFNILDEKRYDARKYGAIKVFIIQVPLEKSIKRLSITLTMNKNYKEEYNSTIEIKSSVNNFFFIDNLSYDRYNPFIENDLDSLFMFFLTFFFDKENNIPLIYQKNLIENLIKRISKVEKVEFRAETALMFLNYCSKFDCELTNIEVIEIEEVSKNKRKPLNKECYLSSEDIDKLNIKKYKSKLIDLIVYIYASYDKEYLMTLIKSEKGKDYCRSVFDLLNDKILKFNELSFENEEELKSFQKNLLSVSTNKNEINYIIKLIKGLTNSLEFIKDNYKTICNILEKNASYFKFEKYNYQLTLESLCKEDNDIQKIYLLLKEIINGTKNKKYKIMDLEEIFDNMIDFYYNKSIYEYCQLHNIVALLKSEKINTKKIEYFYNKVHQKGMNLIRNKKFETAEIINFIISQDIYYYNPIFKSNENRDPIIFEYIPITDADQNYLKNIELIKENDLWNLFSNSSYNTQKKFQEIIVGQMRKFKDFNSIFEIFPIKYFDYNFTLLINGKIGDLIYSILEEKEEVYDLLFKIIDNWFVCNEYNNLDLNYVSDLIELNYDFTSKYYFHILKNKKMQFIAMKIKNNIIRFFLKQNKEGNNNAESLISLLLLAPDDQFCLYFLNQLDQKILKEEDFYQKEENQNYLLFKLFFERCMELIKKPEINQGKYLSESIIMKNKIYNDLKNNEVRYDIFNNLIDEKNTFYNKIVVIEKNEAKKIYDTLCQNLNICKKKFRELEIIEDYYTTFYGFSKREIINVIVNKLKEFKEKNIIEIINCKDFFMDHKEFNLDQAIEESKNIKYKNSCFFMPIYLKKKNEDFEISEDGILKQSIESYIDTITRIINQKESKEPFFGINNIKEIMKAIQNPNNNMEKEIDFIKREFANLGKGDYIRKNLLNDLVNFSNKDKVSKLYQGIIYFIETFDKIKKIEKTAFMNDFKKTYETLISNGVSGEEIKKAIDLLKKYDYDINNETSLIKFYELLLGKEESILFIKKIKDENVEIRNLNEFIDENENSQLQTTDIDNLMDVFTFFNKLMNNDNIKNDENLLKIFREEFDKNKDFIIKLQGYLNTYGEIIQLFQSYHENPEMTIQKIDALLTDSFVKLYKNEKLNLFTFNIEYVNQNQKKVVAELNELEELRNKILMSSTNTNILKKDGDQEDQNNKVSKAKLTKDYVSLIDNIKRLNKTLNSLLKSGYPNIINLTLKVKNSRASDKNYSNKDLQKIILEYKEKNKNFKKSIKNGYEKYPYLRFFYGHQFIQLYEKAKNENIDISYLINSVTLNKIKDIKINYEYNNNEDEIENINKYLEKLFNKNNVNLNEIYNKNKILDDLNLSPGLYRKIKIGDNCSLINNVLNIYLNITNNVPIINTLLICNEDTTIEKIQAFLYRAIFCDKPILFLIANMECLELSVSQSIIKTLKRLYKSKGRIINSLLLIFYEKVDSGLARDIEKLIPEKNLLNNNFLKTPEKKFEIFEKIDLYSSIFSGFGKTTEIIYKVKEKGGSYYYLPIGGSFTRNYVINNLVNLHLDLQNGNNSYLHLDLSETDNDDLMNEILFKLIILRYLDSSEKIYYLGNDIHLIIEIPNGYIEFNKKYKLLNLFNKIHITKLNHLRLEENVKKIGDSPISIVAEVLSLYDNNEIGNKNIDLEAGIEKTALQCEQIINKHFQVQNQNYYQKMNFIKILSIQFKKFTQNVYFNYDIARLDGKEKIIEKARVAVIENFISLTKVFTRSPFDTVLLRQNKSIEIFGKYDANKAVEEGIMALADDNNKQEIFSFKQIKPSLVFFNRDGGSLSIISNNDKKDKEYNNLKTLWNSQNLNKVEELVDYKNMPHEAFLEQIKKLFSLDKMEIADIKKLCENLGNYIFVSDNFIKMVRILLNIEAKIPVILMGETGVGKTKLLEMLATLYGKGTCRWKRLQIHAGTTDQKIVEFIDKVHEDVKNEGAENELTWIFLDEINTCNSLGLITEIMCNHTYLGKKISNNFVFLGACNPYRVLTKRMRESGLVYYNMKEKTQLNNLVYTVNPMPHALLNFVFDFASLQKEDEKKYINNTIISILSRLQRDGLIKNINQNQLNEITNEIVESIVLCHKFIREKYDQSSVSMREIRRFGIFYEYFIKYFTDSSYKKMKSSLNMTLYLCYYLRLNDKGYRKELADKLKHFYKGSSFLKIPENEIKKITEEMTIEKGKGIALNRALRENLFTCFTCIDNNVPLIIVGKPGTGKSLSFQILYNTLKGEYSESEMFRNKGKLYRYYYQGSETSTAEGIEQVFKKASNAQAKNKDKNFITLVFFDEMGLAERSSNNPLKVMHYLLEKDSQDSVPFLGISNWRLDAAKINRALSLTITDYDIQDLEETAISIAEALDLELSNKYNDFFKTLARTYNLYIKFNQNSIKENKDFHGNRDFYNLVKTAMRELIAKRNDIPNNESKILTEVGILSLNRNFGGLENSNSIIKGMFKKEYGHKYDNTVNFDTNFSVFDAIKKNILDPNSRYLMLISEGNDGSDIIKYLLNSVNKKYIELVGSKYKTDIKSGKYSEEMLNKIKYIMETDNALILKDLDMIYASLYDLFNQNFTIMGDKKFARIAFEYAKISSEVNQNFHVIVIVNKTQINNLKLDPPFLNRFEKHIITFNMLLEEKDIEIAKKITDYIELISSFNKNNRLKIDLDRLLINCKQHNIEGLIFKIKNDKKKNENKEWIEKEGPEYEENMMKEVFHKIVPTFCQDIIASMMSSNIDQKYNKIKNIILDIYKECLCNNFESFFKKIKSKKNIIYTFSKVTENLFEEKDMEIKNNMGVFNKQTTTILMIESFKSEEDLIYELNLFVNSQNKKLLILKVTENGSNKINSLNYIITNFEKEYPKLKDKLILFIVHKQRMNKNETSKKGVIPDYISFINEDYYQIFIDNLQGKENSNILKLVEKGNKELADEYINNSNFIENKIFTILNYLNYTILFETKSLNRRNFTTNISEKIINNQKIKEFIQKNLKKQGKFIKNVIKDIFITDIIEINDVDFFEVINSKLSIDFCTYLLKIVLFSLKENVLTQILNNPHFDLIMQNEYFSNFINNIFDKTNFNFVPPIKMNVNANKITIFNGLQIPKSKSYLELLIKYVNEDIYVNYLENEQLLRKNIKQEKIEETIKKYNKKLDRLEENIKIEINKIELFKAIFNQNNIEIKNMILEDYTKYFIIKYIEKKDINYLINEKLLNFLNLIIQVKFSDKHNQYYEYENTIEEFIKIVLFTQGYKEDIKILFDIYIELEKYCPNIEERMMNILEEDIIKYEISERNRRYTKIVNINIFNIIESLLRAILLYSIELINKDKVKFYEYFYSLTSIEANLQKINKKYYLFSKEIFNIRYIIKIEEAYKYNHDQFENNYENIINNLLQQSIYIYNDNYNNLYNIILDLAKIFDETFIEKNEEYVNLLFFIFKQQYKNIYNEDIRIKLIESFLNNKLLVTKSKIFLTETLKDIKPEIITKKKEKEETFINNFMNITDNKKVEKLKNLINTCNKINSPQFNEVLLYFFETQCQSYFLSILNKYENKYTENCCEELLLKLSIAYLKKAIQYLYEHKDNNDNNFLKLYAIAYVKTYSYFYVEVNYAHPDKCKWDEINRLLNDKDENNQLIRNMRNIYIWRLYCKKFENFEKFINFEFAQRNIPIIDELSEKIKKENEGAKYIFKESFITEKSFQKYKQMSLDIDNKYIKEQKEIQINYDEVNNNFDLYYSILVNKIISYTYGNEKNIFFNRMKNVYDSSYKSIKLGEEGKKLYQYLLNNNLFQNEVTKKISDNPLTQEEFEILLYSLRFIFNSQINNNNCFYNNILKKNTSNFINNNYIPGSFPLINEYLKSYNILNEKLKQRLNMGYYICKDCGFLYEVKPCTFPMATDKCPNGHVIGGIDHVCSKKDIRVFYEKVDDDNFSNKWRSYPNWLNSYVHTTLNEFKINYVDKNIIKPQKGIIKDFEIFEFEKKSPIRDINIISFRILNFILYSYLVGSYILNNLSKNEAQNYLVENLFPHTLFGIVKKNWELLGISLKEVGVENIQIFMNMIFDKISELINNLKSVDTVEQLTAFEKEVDKYIMEIISKKENIEKLNKNYETMNNALLSFDPQSIKEIVLGNYDPSIYSQKQYPDIQYYTVSNIQDFNSFVNIFNSSKENENKYSLINLLVKSDEDITKDAINMKNLDNINKLTNILINIYSYKISREDGKVKILEKELGNIIDTYNEMNPIKINNEEEFINDYVNPFIKSWDQIKRKSVQYKCRILRDLDKGEQPLDMTINNPINNFLVDDGDKEGGMFLASAYQHLIDWQNAFINIIISKNSMNGILNSYVAQLDQEINVQDAIKEEIINIDDKTFKSMYDLINSSSMRNIFGEENKINYKNYNNIAYNFDYIEEELGKLILPGIKKFKNNKIKFITYLFEGLRGENTSVLVNYNNKYNQKELTNDEKEALNELLKANNNNKFYNEVFASLQILMNEIIKENYDQNHLIYKIIENRPNYMTLNEELVKLFKDKYEYFMEEKVFTINSLVSVFEYFEALCWKDIKKNVLLDYQLDLPEEAGKFIQDYFEKNKKEEKIINKKNFTTALRRLISRYIAGSRQETDIKPEAKLKLFINRDDLWSQDVVENDLFIAEIDEICKDEILTCHCWKLYNLLDGDSLMDDKSNKNKEKEEKQKQDENAENVPNELEINTDSNQNEEGKQIDKKKEENDDDDDDEKDEEEEEEREEF